MQVRETIVTSALLQLPLSMSRREKLACVNDIISQLVCSSAGMLTQPAAHVAC